MATGDGRNVENLLHSTKELTDHYVGNVNDLRTDHNKDVTLESPSVGGVAVSTPKPNIIKDFILNESYLHSDNSNSNDSRNETLTKESEDGKGSYLDLNNSFKHIENVCDVPSCTFEEPSISVSSSNDSCPLLHQSLPGRNDNDTKYDSVDNTIPSSLFRTPSSTSKRKYDDLSESGDEFKGFSFTATTDSPKDLTLNGACVKILKRKRENSASDEDDCEIEETKDEGVPKSQTDSRSSDTTAHATVELSEPGKQKPRADDADKLLSLERGGNEDKPKPPSSSEQLIHIESHGMPADSSAKPESSISRSYAIDIDDDPAAGDEGLESEGSGSETDVEDNALDLHSLSSLRLVPDPDIDKHLPDTVTLLTTPEGAKVYLVGTAHFSSESQEDVAMIIRAVQPHVVLVELCQARVNILQLDEKTILEEAKNINLEKIQSTIKQNGVFHGVMYLLLLSMSAHLTKQLGMAPGGEFRRAFAEAKRVPSCLVHLGDRPIQITLKRALASLSWWQTLRLTWHLLMSKEPISKEEVERCKRRDLLEEMLAEMAGEFPALGTVFVNERDIYLAHSLHLAALPVANSLAGPVPARVVGVVGIGHVPGIVQHWGKVLPADIPPIMQLPPPSLSGRVLKLTVQASCICVVVWGVSKLLPQSSWGALKSSVQGLFSA